MGTWLTCSDHRFFRGLASLILKHYEFRLIYWALLNCSLVVLIIVLSFIWVAFEGFSDGISEASGIYASQTKHLVFGPKEANELYALGA
jgi:hypothetical protein